MTRVEWTYTVETSRLLRALSLVALGALGGLFGLVGVLALFVLAGSLIAGEFAVLALLLGFSLLTARRLVAHAALARSEGGLPDPFSARELLAASVAWAVVLGALLALDASSRVLYACVVAAVLGCLPVAAALRSEGYVDTDDGVFEANDREVSLSAVDRVSRYDLGPIAIAVLWIRYHDGAGGASAPRLLGVPAERASRVRDALESADASPPGSDRNPAITRALYAFAAGSFALAVAFAYFAANETGDAAGVGVYVAVFAAFFGALFAWLGYVEG